MKTRLLVSLVGISLLSIPAFSQAHKGEVELSFGASSGSIALNTRGVGVMKQVPVYRESVRYLTVSGRAGFFVSNPLSLEPEINILATSNSSPGVTISVNVLYHVWITNSQFTPFALIGFGHSNCLPGALDIDSPVAGLSYVVNNLGVGVKVHAATHLAFRVEYRRQEALSFERVKATPAGLVTITEAESDNVLLGLSVIL